MPRGNPSPFTANGNKSLSRDEISQKIHNYAYRYIHENNNCCNSKTKRETKCQCIGIFREDERLFGLLKNKLEKYQVQNPQGRQVFLHGIITHANLRRMELPRGEKRTAVNALTGVVDDEGDVVHVCNNTLTGLFCIGFKQFKKLEKDAMIPTPKDTSNYEDNMNSIISSTQNVINFLWKQFRDEGETHATQVV